MVENNNRDLSNIERAQNSESFEEDEYTDSETVDLDQGLTLPKSNHGYDASEDEDEDLLVLPTKKKDVKPLESDLTKDSTSLNKENGEVKKTFTPFKESFSTQSDKKDEKKPFTPFVEKVGSSKENKDNKEKETTFTPFKESFSTTSKESNSLDVGFVNSGKKKVTAAKVTTVDGQIEVVDFNDKPVNINSLSDSQLSELFKKKMLEIIFGSNQEEKQIDKVDEDDEPIIELDNVPGGERRGKKRIKILEQTNVTYSTDSYGTPKCLPKGFRNTKYSKKTRWYMRIDFSSWLFLICFLLVAGIAYASYALYNFAFVPYLGILELSWLNIYTFMIPPFAVGIFSSILINDFIKHLVAFYTGYKVLTFKMFGFTFYHYGKKTRKVGFNLRNIFCFRHEYVPRGDKITRNPFFIYLFSGVGQLIFFGVLWSRYYKFVQASDPRYLFWADQPQTVLLWLTFFTFLYALVPFIYNNIPIKTRIKNDAYTLFQIRGKNDRTCFNICAINEIREVTGEDFTLAPISCNIQNYFQYYAYFYTYLSRLYNEDYKNARKDLHYLRQLTSVASKKDRHRVDFERSYIRYLYSDPADAEVIFAKVKKGRKRAIKPRLLSDYRICIEICANILQDSKRIINFVEKLNSFLPYYPKPGKRIIKEYQFIAYSLKNVQEIIPNIKLPELSQVTLRR